MQKRWPLHPVPLEAESLASWVQRIGTKYNYSVQETCKLLIGRPFSYVELERDASGELFQALHERTGVALGEMQNRTYTELVQTENTVAIANGDDHSTINLKHHSMLCSLGNKLRPSWGPNPWLWRSAKKGKWPKACSECAHDEPFYRRIYWSFPFLTTCPIHGIFLNPLRIKDNHIGDEMSGTKVPEKILELDQLTYSGIVSGVVNFHGTIIAITRWLSILRNLISELSLCNLIPREDKALLDTIWRRAGGRPQNPYRISFEAVKFSHQIDYMHATAVVLDMIATDEISPRGEHTYLLRDRLNQFSDIIV